MRTSFVLCPSAVTLLWVDPLLFVGGDPWDSLSHFGEISSPFACFSNPICVLPGTVEGESCDKKFTYCEELVGIL